MLSIVIVSSPWSSISCATLRENITLLWMLDKEPERPMHNQLPQHLLSGSEQSFRQLTIKRERDIVDDLAFLSASSEDSTKVIALCIEEYPSAETLTIRFAMNTGDLQFVNDGLVKLAAILKQAATRGSGLISLGEIWMLT